MNREAVVVPHVWSQRSIAVARVLTGFFLFMSGIMKLGPHFDMAKTLNLFAHGLPALRHLSLSRAEFQQLVNAHPELQAVAIEENPLFQTLAAGHPPGWYKQFLVNIAIPHAPVFSFLVTWGEIIVGFLLMIGLATRMAGMIAIFMHVNYHLASSWLGGASAFINIYAILITGVIVASSAGRIWGIDGWLAKRKARRI